VCSSDLIKPYIRLGSDNVAYLDGNGIWVRLGSSFALSHGVSIEAYDNIGGIGKDGDDTISNTVQLTLTVAF
jgi:hypothetical protein